nr:uncharacterized protein LOC111992585 [Quercus suber]
MCELCGKEEETICHLFWFCDHARGVWTSSKFVIPFEISLSWNFLDVVENLQRREESCPGLLEKVIMVCWSIWKNRNVLRLGGKGMAGCSLVRGALYLVDEFLEANVEKLENWVETTSMVAWKPPRLGQYKVNTDGVVFSNRKQAGAWVFIRDEAGDVVAALSKKWNYPLGAVEAKARALEAGVCFARDMGIWAAEFEKDSLEIFNAVQGLSSPPSSVANVLAA